MTQGRELGGFDSSIFFFFRYERRRVKGYPKSFSAGTLTDWVTGFATWPPGGCKQKLAAHAGAFLPLCLLCLGLGLASPRLAGLASPSGFIWRAALGAHGGGGMAQRWHSGWLARSRWRPPSPLLSPALTCT